MGVTCLKLGSIALYSAFSLSVPLFLSLPAFLLLFLFLSLPLPKRLILNSKYFLFEEFMNHIKHNYATINCEIELNYSIIIKVYCRVKNVT